MQDAVDFNLLKEYDTALKEVLEVWTKHKVYSLKDKVKYRGHLLECTTAGTSGTTTLDFTGLDVGDTITDGTVVWEIVEPLSSSGVDLPEWQANTSYTAGKYLVYEGTVYKVTTNFTSGTTFDDTNLTAYISPIMGGATSSVGGTSGLVPQPTTSDISKFLCGDGTWKSAGGSGLNVIDNTLWSGIFNSVVVGDTLTLQNDYADYDEIILYIGGQYCRSLIASLGDSMGFDNDGGSLGANYSSHVIISFGGNSCNAIIWRYGTNMASSEVRLVGRKYINPNNYSTTEQEIGTWIDGKPLYQVTITGNTPNTSAETSIYTLNADECIDITGYCKFGDEFNYLPYWYGSSNYSYLFYDRLSGDVKIKITNSSYQNIPMYITVKYTKV